MSSLPAVDDLRLVEAVARHGSVGAAARELLISQPAASNRLAALERRVGEKLFDRDTTGARPTSAGRSLSDQAAHVLEHLETIFTNTRAAAHAQTLRIGSFSSIAACVFPALAQLAPHIVVNHVTDHGDRLIELVGEGSLDAAFVAIANQLRLPAGTTAVPVARDHLVVLAPSGVTVGKGRRPFADRDVAAYTYDMSGETLLRKLSDLGGRPRRGATAETTVRLARVLKCPAVLPNGLARNYVTASERILPSPIQGRLTLFMVTRRPAPPALTAIVDDLYKPLGLEHP